MDMKLAKTAVDAALGGGAHYADARANRTAREELALRNGEVDAADELLLLRRAHDARRDRKVKALDVGALNVLGCAVKGMHADALCPSGREHDQRVVARRSRVDR